MPTSGFESRHSLMPPDAARRHRQSLGGFAMLVAPVGSRGPRVGRATGAEESEINDMGEGLN